MCSLAPTGWKEVAYSTGLWPDLGQPRVSPTSHLARQPGMLSTREAGARLWLPGLDWVSLMTFHCENVRLIGARSYTQKCKGVVSARLFAGSLARRGRLVRSHLTCLSLGEHRQPLTWKLREKNQDLEYMYICFEFFFNVDMIFDQTGIWSYFWS